MGVVVVGGGQAGACVARSARDAGYRGSITLIGKERHLPYERPPLSKAGLTAVGNAHVPVLTADEFRQLDIELAVGKAVVSLDREKQSVECDDGSRYQYDRLVLATGGRPRHPVFPGSHQPGVFTLRTLEDAEAIAQRMQPHAHMVVVGGGWIGLEAAAAARARGMTVTVLESLDRLCARSMPPRISAYLLDKHRANGVRIMLSTSVERLQKDKDGRLVATTTPNGSDIEPADLVVLGVGLVPNTEVASTAGLAVDNGIVVNEFGVTSDPNIFATGDVANLPCSWWSGNRLRLESWANAQNHGIAVGRAVAGDSSPYDELPWFWSDQFDLNIQMVGLCNPNTEEVLRGDPTGNSFTLFQLRDGSITAAVCVNAPRDLRHARNLIKARQRVDPIVLGDMLTRLDKMPKPGA